MDKIIYHANCVDGFTAAYVAHMRYPFTELVPLGYGDPVPEYKDMDILIVDFSFKRKDLETLKANNKSLIVLDHHETAQAELQGLDYCIFDMTKCGAVLTWEYCYPNMPIPQIVLHIQDRDLWTWKLPNSKEVSAYIATRPKTIDEWSILFYTGINYISRIGAGVLAYQSQLVERICSQAIPIKWGSYDCMFVNSSVLEGEVGDKLSEGDTIAVIWYQTKKGDYKYSLRSKGDINVAALAKNHGGGGHKNAAGFLSSMQIGG